MSTEQDAYYARLNRQAEQTERNQRARDRESAKEEARRKREDDRQYMTGEGGVA
jgi:hypothetical protein